MARPVHSVEEVRQRAKRRLPRVAFDFIDGGAGDEITMRENRRAFQDLALRPRYLQDVSERDQSVTVLGRKLSTPVLLSPAGLQRIAHREGELAAAQAAADHDTIYTLTSNSSISLEDVAHAVPRGSFWFQLYMWRNRERNAELLERARKQGCEVLVVTVDVPVAGKKDRDRRNGFTIPLQPNASMVLDMATHPRWIYDYLRGGPITFANFTEMGKGAKPTELFKYINTELAHPGATRTDLEWLRDQWGGKIVVKGTLTGEDAAEAVDCGVDAVWVSNHGGRQLDGVQATIAALPEVVAAVKGRAEVYVDGGVRRGTDVLMALALGANAVMIGRPYVFGLAMDGRAGAGAVIDLFKHEIDLALALIGRPKAAEVDLASIRPARSSFLHEAGVSAAGRPLDG